MLSLRQRPSRAVSFALTLGLAVALEGACGGIDASLGNAGACPATPCPYAETWDALQCACVPVLDAGCAVVTAVCNGGYTFDPLTCRCVVPVAPPDAGTTTSDAGIGAGSCTGTPLLCFGSDATACCGKDPAGYATCVGSTWMCGPAPAPGCNGVSCLAAFDAGKTVDAAATDAHADVHVDAVVDASSVISFDATFLDGGIAAACETCDPATQICSYMTHLGVTTSTCLPLPTGCTTCQCVQASAVAAGNCGCMTTPNQVISITFCPP